MTTAVASGHEAYGPVIIDAASIRAMMDNLGPDDGFTIGLDGRVPHDGYMVALAPDAYDDSQSLSDWLDKVAARGRDAYVGGWKDPRTGKTYLDMSVRVATLDRALRIARRHGELAVYDLTHGETVYT